jgi:hypothetical protein
VLRSASTQTQASSSKADRRTSRMSHEVPCEAWKSNMEGSGTWRNGRATAEGHDATSSEYILADLKRSKSHVKLAEAVSVLFPAHSPSFSAEVHPQDLQQHRRGLWIWNWVWKQRSNSSCMWMWTFEVWNWTLKYEHQIWETNLSNNSEQQICATNLSNQDEQQSWATNASEFESEFESELNLHGSEFEYVSEFESDMKLHGSESENLKLDLNLTMIWICWIWIWILIWIRIWIWSESASVFVMIARAAKGVQGMWNHATSRSAVRKFKCYTLMCSKPMIPGSKSTLHLYRLHDLATQIN